MSKPEIEYNIPGRLNIALSVFSVATCLLLLYIATRTSGWQFWAVGFLFSLCANTVFSLMHESVHRVYHPNKRVNEAMGRIAAAIFPTSFTFQRAMHLGHHRRNRTDVEMFDMYYSDDNLFLKYMQWYGLLTGFYWALIPVACMAFLVFPWLLSTTSKQSENSISIMRTGAAAMLSGLKGYSSTIIRIEVLAATTLHVCLIASGFVSWQAWLFCYWMFAVNWGALQYADHAWSPRDIKNGAWNLRVHPLLRVFFLNYHDHKAHHQNPHVSWIHLPKLVKESDAERPGFFEIYWRMWKGPTLTTDPPPAPLDSNLDILISKDSFRSSPAKYPKSL
ncbi:MAG: fatty acid desaturase [Deltaproteobacteria bacterium]|nr:fatty acid desaturase [Deltaproteobacteria bacterium]